MMFIKKKEPSIFKLEKNIDIILQELDHSNIFKFCLDEEITLNKAYYYIGDIFENTLSVISIDSVFNKIYSYSNEWLYLIKHYYSHHQSHYVNIVNNYKNVLEITNPDTTFSEDDIIPFITSFSSGTAHGYTGLFFILNEYISFKKKYKKYKIAIYIDSQSGILDILDCLIQKKVLDKNKIIYLSSGKKYLFNSILFIPNRWHSYPKRINLKIIKKYLVDNQIHDKLKNKHQNICIIKNSESTKLTSSGIVSKEDVDIFCELNNLTLLEPGKINEIKLISLLYSCSKLIVSWGTSFFKNYIYISNTCQSIVVLIVGDEFISQYYRLKENDELITKYKDAFIIYKIVDFNLNVISELDN